MAGGNAVREGGSSDIPSKLSHLWIPYVEKDMTDIDTHVTPKRQSSERRSSEQTRTGRL